MQFQNWLLTKTPVLSRPRSPADGSRCSDQPQVTNSKMTPFSNSSIARGGWRVRPGQIRGSFWGDLRVLTDGECHWSYKPRRDNDRTRRHQHVLASANGNSLSCGCGGSQSPQNGTLEDQNPYIYWKLFSVRKENCVQCRLSIFLYDNIMKELSGCLYHCIAIGRGHDGL